MHMRYIVLIQSMKQKQRKYSEATADLLLREEAINNLSLPYKNGYTWMNTSLGDMF